MSQEQVTLVIPGRNCARTIRPCLEALLPLLSQGRLAEIIFVNDGSTDNTEQIVQQYPVRCLKGEGRGPGAARNIGWRAAQTPLIWFVDSDCVAEPQALDLLLEQMEDPRVGGVGGNYSNGLPDHLLACLIHEEIVARHDKMPREVGYLATFNVIYRRRVLQTLDGFDESLRTAEDADFAFRVRKAGYRLRFERLSRVAHFHPTQLYGYLRTQARHGFYRMMLYRRHPERMAGDSYSNFMDHIQPPLAMCILGGLPAAYFFWGQVALLALISVLCLTTLPMTLRLVARTQQPRYLAFAPLSFVRSFARGIGLTLGVLASVRRAPEMTRQAETDAPHARAA